MPSSQRAKPKPRPAARPSKPARPAASRAAPKKPAAKPSPAKPKSRSGSSRPERRPNAAPEVVVPPRPTGRIHVLSLSFVRDGDEFMARMETDGGQITELKNRSLDQLLTLVASELEDLLE
jgi:hypothetical protein